MQNNNNSIASPSWFQGAPLTRLMAYITGLSYAIMESRGAHEKMAVDTEAIIEESQYFRFLTGTLSFRTFGEIVVGLVLLANFSRRFEREMGTRKYAVFLVASAVLSVVFQMIVARLGIDFDYSGPYPMVGALVCLFHLYAPRLHPRFFSIASIHFSEKTMPYAFSAQLICYRGFDSLIPCACGMAASYLVLISLPKSYLDVPDVIVKVVSTSLRRIIDDPPAPLLVMRQGRTHFPRAAPPSATAPIPRATPIFEQPVFEQPVFEQPPPPPESMIEQLTSMGFARDDVLRALQTSHNNVERAAHILLSGAD